MRRRFLGAARRLIIAAAFSLSVAVGFVILPAGSVFAVGSDTAKAQLTIQSSECVIDVVQDGSGQNLQVPSAACNVILPNLLVPVLGQKPAQLPFAGEDAAVPIVARQVPIGEEQEAEPTPVASVSNQVSTAQSAGTVTAIVAGIGTVAAATAVGVDAALFEFSHSKSAARWAKQRVTRKTTPN